MSTVAIVPQSTGIHEIVTLSDRHGANRINGDVTIIAVFEGEEMIQPGRQGEYNAQFGRYEMLPPVMGKIVCALARRNTESELQKALDSADYAEKRLRAVEDATETTTKDLSAKLDAANARIERLLARTEELAKQVEEADKKHRTTWDRAQRMESDLAKLRGHFGKKAFDEAIGTPESST